MPIGAPETLMVGGPTSSGPTPGIYRAKVTEVNTGASTQKGTPFIELDLHGHKDEQHPAKEGKRITKHRIYLPHPDLIKKANEGDTEAVEKVQQLNGMTKRTFKGYGVPFPKETKKFDPRQFLNKEVFIELRKGKADDEGESRTEVSRVASEREALEPSGGVQSEKAAAAPKGRRN